MDQTRARTREKKKKLISDQTSTRGISLRTGKILTQDSHVSLNDMKFQQIRS